ncbi:acyl-CoA dehydrogenase [Jiangella anatolica]|uniref:Acyl-CoA dehydrogenase n=2 Tax=Jiangella anatolica TaxID=2670374 RepID=A0A2W2C2D4_9ACTN|nr:acyl-CoA dehydrogenase [Jiangella anatolica]
MNSFATLPLPDFRKAVRSWIAEHAPQGLAEVHDWNRPVIGAMDTEPFDRAERHPLYREWERRLLAAGLVCPQWPVEYGGSGWTPDRAAAFVEECHRAGVPRVTRHMGEDLVAPALLAHGTEEQKAYFLPRIRTGEHRYCQGFSEPDSGSDLASLRTRGRVDGDRVVVSGQKTWTSLAELATHMFTLCRTEPGSSRHRGISYVLIELDDPGVQIRPIPQITGRSEFCEVFLDEVPAPLFNVVGGLGDGWRVAMTTLGAERGGKASTQRLGFEREVTDLLRLLTDQGRMRDPLVRRQLALALGQVEVMRMQGDRVLAGVMSGRLDRGLDPSTGKLMWSEFQRELGDLLARVLGPEFVVRPDGAGFPLDEWQDLFLASRADTIYAGTSQIQRNLIAERVLGLPRGEH